MFPVLIDKQDFFKFPLQPHFEAEKLQEHF